MNKVVWKDINKKRFTSTLYDSINKFENIEFVCKLETLEASLRKQDTYVAFSYALLNSRREN